MLHLQLRSTIRAREQMVKTSRAPHAAAPVQTPSPTNATRERRPTRSTPDTGSRRASHTLSRRERAHMPPAPSHRLKRPCSEPDKERSRDARSREAKRTPLHQGCVHGCPRTSGQVTRRGSDQPRTISNTQCFTHHVITSLDRESSAAHNVPHERQTNSHRVNTQRSSTPHRHPPVHTCAH